MSRTRNKVSFPRAKPAPGMAYITLAYKTETGLRMEFNGQLPKDLVDSLMLQACKGAGVPGLNELKVMIKATGDAEKGGAAHG